MILGTILISHVLLAVFVTAGFMFRYFQTFKAKSYSTNGRKTIYTGAALLVVSGVGLSIISKDPMTSICISSLALISILMVMELGIVGLAKKVS
jgi:surface polysaccharide O-acyltransferase-like enzyme